ncbi:MAG: LCP family protein [Actinomycetota bacterium]|nr:LCP family protein [Actinomycetota bacterium]
MSQRRKLVILLTAAVVSSGIAWTSLGGINLASGQTPTPTTEIHRAHAGSFAPEPGKTIFILALGSDSGAKCSPYHRGGTQQGGRSDSIHIIAINPVLGKASIVGIPRDSFVPIPGNGKHKINAAMFFGGPKLAIATIEALSGVHFDYYMLTNFCDLRDMGNEFGGLTIKIPYDMDDKFSKAHFKAGVRHLNGADVLAFSRNRHDARGGDLGRSFNQGAVMQAAQVQARKELLVDPTKLLKYLQILRRHVATDIPLLESLRLGLLALRISPSAVTNVVVSGHGETTSDGSSIVLSPNAYKTFRDVADDGVLGS